MKSFLLKLALVAFGLTGNLFAEATVAEVDLFNGRDLTGWKIVGGNGQFKAVNGAIVGFGKNVKGNTFLRTEKEFSDFELRYEFKFLDITGNSGLMFRAKQKPSADSNGRVFGYQCEADNTKRAWTAGLFDEARRGWLYPVKGGKLATDFTEQGVKLFKWNDWNTIVIRCEGNRIQTWLNGEKRVDYRDKDQEHDTRKGFIGLQVHHGASCNVSWRNLTLKELNTTK